VKSFLLALSEGVAKETLSKDHLFLANELTQLKACTLSNNTYKLEANHRAGKVDVAASGTGFLEVYEAGTARKDLLIEPKDLKGAMRGDLVVAKRLPIRKGRPKAKVVYIVKRASGVAIVYTKTVHKHTVGIHLKTGLTLPIAASQKSLKELPEATVLAIDAASSAIIEVLGNLNDPKVDEKIALAAHGKVEFFSPEAEAESKAHGTTVDKSLYPDRTDLTHLPFCTIDPPDAKDFDDAIYFDQEACVLYVAIADVSEYVFPFGPTDKEAKERGFSIYFPHKSIPMLPRTLSENICSLKPNEDRLAFCFKITLDKNALHVKHEELLNVVIHSKRRFTYDEVDRFLAGDFSQQQPQDAPVLPWLLALKETIFKVRKKRLYDGFEFRSNDIRMEVDKEQNLIATLIETETPSHSLIEDCMLLANQAAAKRIQKGIFRNHEAPSFERIEELLVDLETIGLHVSFSPDLPKLIGLVQEQADALGMREDVDKLIIKSQKRAMYEPLSKGHFGLGFETYTHFTSPIRRYSDLLLHRLLKTQLSGDEKLHRYLLTDIESVCEKVSTLERESDKVAWDYMDRKFARWGERHLGKAFKAVVTDVEKALIARLDDVVQGARIFIINDEAELLERVEITLVEADIASAKLFGRITKRLDP